MLITSKTYYLWHRIHVYMHVGICLYNQSNRYMYHIDHPVQYGTGTYIYSTCMGERDVPTGILKKNHFFSQNDWYCTSSVLLKEYIYDNFCKRRTEVVDLCVCSLYINTPVCILCPWHTCVYSLFLTHLFTCQICPTHLYVLQPGLRHLVFGHYFMPLVLGLQSVDKFNLFALRKSIRKNIPFQHKKSLPCNQ